jgi:hypothetical protein
MQVKVNLNFNQNQSYPDLILPQLHFLQGSWPGEPADFQHTPSRRSKLICFHGGGVSEFLCSQSFRHLLADVGKYTKYFGFIPKL